MPSSLSSRKGEQNSARLKNSQSGPSPAQKRSGRRGKEEGAKQSCKELLSKKNGGRYKRRSDARDLGERCKVLEKVISGGGGEFKKKGGGLGWEKTRADLKMVRGNAILETS